MSCVKVINRLNSTDKIGLLVISISRDAMENVIGQFPVQRDIYVVMNRGMTVYQSGYDKEQFGNSLDAVLRNEDGRYLVTEHQCGETDWTLVHAVRRSDIFADASTVRTIIVVIGVFAAAVVVVLCILQARQITRPLEQLKKDIQRVGEGKRNFRNTFGDDEVGVIGREFQNMVTQQLQLKEQVAKEELLRKDSELQLLQSQINPHFLYNTLDTLYWMALGEDAEQSAELTQALSEIFKISLSEGEEFIAVRDEIKFIEDYLYIQNVRFEDKFLVQIQVDEEIRDIRILKQIIQPFVENAIYHGLEPKFGKGSLMVMGAKEDGYLVFQVADDGVGIDEDVDIMKGYAVSNVYQRLKLHYGEKAELKFDSCPGGGTVVTVRIPLEEVGDAEDRID
jgi:two-component system sensor histidine kinase YesM